MQRAYPARINWQNEPSTNSPINDTNLNKMDAALYTIDGRVVELDTSKANQSDLLTCLSGITYDTTTGVFTFIWKNGVTYSVDLNIEKIPVSFSMDEYGVITMTTTDGTHYTADIGNMLRTFADESEAWANGTKEGTDVPSTDPAYHNNSKYWAGLAQQAAADSVNSISLTATTDGTISDTPTVTVTKTGTNKNPIFNVDFHGLKGAKGDKGDKGDNGTNGTNGTNGVGIGSIVKTGTTVVDGRRVDTYTITYTDSNTFAYDVVNGKDGDSASVPFDDYPASGSTNAVRSNGIYEKIMEEKNSSVHWGNQSKGYVGKNELIVDAVSEIKNGVTFTVNEDKSITLNNTATSTWGWNISEPSATSNLRSLRGTYILSYEGTLASGCGISLQLSNGNYINIPNTVPHEISVTFTDAVYATGRLHIYIVSGSVWSNNNIKPMIRLASISDSTYEPYLIPNTDLMSYADNAILGAKNWNLFPYHNTTKTLADITYTVDDDGVIDVNGTSTGEGQFEIHNINEMPNLLHDVTYILSGAPNVAYSTSDVRLRLITFKDDNTGRVNYDCPQGGEIQFTIPTGHHFHQLAYYIASGKTLNHVKVKPMIRLASDTDSTYAPGAMTNKQLTDAVGDVETLLAAL